jgi:uncharacterized protein
VSPTESSAAETHCAFRLRYGPWALVTGASSGIGEHFARQLAARGFNVVVVARRTTLLDALASELTHAHGIEVKTLGADLSTVESVRQVAEACADKDIGLVVCNAGFGLKGEHSEQPPERIQSMVVLNCLVPALLAQSWSKTLATRGRGGLVFTGSLEGFVGFPYSSAYAASKAFVLSLGEGLSGELRRSGVDVLVVAPGPTDTDAPRLQGVDRSALIGLMTPADVAAQALSHLGKRPVFVPGALNRALVGTITTLPRRVSSRLVGWGMRRALERSGWTSSLPPH